MQHQTRYSFPLVDAHLHQWQLGFGRYDWIEGAARNAHFGSTADLRHDYLDHDALRDTAGFNLVGCILVESVWSGSDPLDEVRFLEKQGTKLNVPFKIVAQADFGAADLKQQLALYRDTGSVAGVRALLFPPGALQSGSSNADLFTDERWKLGFSALGELGLSFDLQCTPPMLGQTADLLRAFPDVRFALTHCGLPLGSSRAEMEVWRNGIDRVACQPNAAVKVSGLGMCRKEMRPEELVPIIAHLMQSFGPDRCMFGSNFPVDRLFTTYQALVSAVVQALDRYPDEVKAKLMGQNARKFYGLE